MVTATAPTPVKLLKALGQWGTLHDVEDVAPVIDRIVARLDLEADCPGDGRGNQHSGGLQRLGNSWAGYSRDESRHTESAVRRLYAIRSKETTRVSAEMVDEILCSQYENISDYDIPIFPGSKRAGEEMAEAWLAETSGEPHTAEDVTRLGLSLYHFTVGYFSWDKIEPQTEALAA